MATDYKQYDYPDFPYAAETIAIAGCGPCACADILDVDPTQTAQWLEGNGYAYPYQGTVYEGIAACLTAFGADGKMLARDMDGQTSAAVFRQWREIIQNGQMGILLMHNVVSNYWTNGGHYIAIVAWDEGKFLVYDPASPVRTGWHPWSDFSGNISALYTSSKRWDGGKIAVDGWWGPATTKLAQKVFKTTLDGLISNQNKDMQKFLPACQPESWRFVPASKLDKGSELVKAIQRMLGIPDDGFFGMKTCVALQQFLSVDVDGYFGPQSVAAWQRWLNSQI